MNYGKKMFYHTSVRKVVELSREQGGEKKCLVGYQFAIPVLNIA